MRVFFFVFKDTESFDYNTSVKSHTVHFSSHPVYMGRRKETSPKNGG